MNQVFVAVKITYKLQTKILLLNYIDTKYSIIQLIKKLTANLSRFFLYIKLDNNNLTRKDLSELIHF